MYESFYGLKEKPFSMLPDPGFLYLSKKHQMALTMLEYGLMNHAGFCVVSGETGSGKTTLLRKLLENIEPNITVGMITNTHKGFGEFLTWILSAFNIHEQGMSVVDMHQRFVDFVIEQYAANKTTLLIVDEAQNITAEKLEELRMLSNVNSEQDQVLQVILAGQPELKDTLRLPELKQFAQRISVDYHLGALSEDETCGYIEHRLNIAGADRNIFTDEACKLIHEYSGGIPRLINLLCDTALVYGFADQQETIDEVLVDEMVRERMADSIVPINKEALSKKPATRKKQKKPQKKPQQKQKPENISSDDDKKHPKVITEGLSQTIEHTDNVPLTETDESQEKRVSTVPERRNLKSPERRTTEVEEKPADKAKPVNDAIRQATEGYKKKIQSNESEVPDSGEEKKSRAASREPVNEGVKLRGPNTIAIINPESLNKGWLSTWGIGIVVVAILVIAGILLPEIQDQLSEDKVVLPSSDSRSEKKVLGDNSGDIPDTIKQQLDEAEKFRRELARQQQEDRERMDELEKQALELKKERDAAIARAKSEEEKRAKDAAAVRAAKARERKAKAEAEKAKAEAALIEAEKARILLEVKKAEIDAREKKLQEQQTMLEKAKQEEAEAEKRAQQQLEEEERMAVSKKEEKRFRTDPCSSSTARFLSTCR
jgi:type II secretory pathway predicted ATPase ExeA